MDENEKIIKNIEATCKIEGLELTNEDKTLISSFLNNEIDEKQGIDKLRKMYL